MSVDIVSREAVKHSSSAFVEKEKKKNLKMQAALQGVPSDAPMTVRHPSFNNRPLPVLQLVSQMVKSDGTLTDDALAKIANDKEVIRRNSKQENKEYPKSNVSVLNQIFNPADDQLDLIPETNHGKSKPPHPAASTETNLIFGGGNDDPDRWNTTASLQGKGESALDKKKLHGKKTIGSATTTSSMINPITGEVPSGYLIWAQEQQEKEAKIEAESRLKKEMEEIDNENDTNAMDDEPLLIKLRKSLFKRGAKGLLGLSRTFKIMDDDDSKTLSLAEFTKAMKYCSVDMSNEDIQKLFQIFGKRH